VQSLQRQTGGRNSWHRNGAKNLAPALKLGTKKKKTAQKNGGNKESKNPETQVKPRETSNIKNLMQVATPKKNTHT